MNDTRKWWLRKAALLLFLVGQFYLAKQYGEPYPCIILPSFAKAYPIEELPAASGYTFLADHEETVDTLQLSDLFPFVPPNYWFFTAEHLFKLSAAEERAWQLMLREQLKLNSPTVLRVEKWTNKWEIRHGAHETVRNKAAVREIPLDHGLPE